MRISYLAEHTEFIPLLAAELVEHFCAYASDDNMESRVAKLHRHTKTDTLPIAWVAHCDGEELGTAALRTHDLDDRQDLSPWLGGVFVRAEFRRRGTAATLCNVVEAKAWSLGHTAIYLFTTDRQAYYARLGWVEFERHSWCGQDGLIMIKEKPDT